MTDVVTKTFYALILMTVVMAAPILLAADSVNGQQPHPSSMTSKPTPQILSVEGSVTAIELKTPVRTMKLTSAKGRPVVLMFDVKGAPVWHNGQAMEASQLKAGMQVRVRYLRQEDKSVIKSIELLEEAESNSD